MRRVDIPEDNYLSEGWSLERDLHSYDNIHGNFWTVKKNGSKILCLQETSLRQLWRLLSKRYDTHRTAQQFTRFDIPEGYILKQIPGTDNWNVFDVNGAPLLNDWAGVHWTVIKDLLKLLRLTDA